MQRVLLFALAVMLIPAGMGCRDKVAGDSYPMVLVSDGRSLLPTTERSYDARILDGTAQAIGLQGDDGAPSARPARDSGSSSGADDAGGSIRNAFRNLNELARKAFGEPQPDQPDQQDSDPDADDSNQ